MVLWQWVKWEAKSCWEHVLIGGAGKALGACGACGSRAGVFKTGAATAAGWVELYECHGFNSVVGMTGVVRGMVTGFIEFGWHAVPHPTCQTCSMRKHAQILQCETEIACGSEQVDWGSVLDTLVLGWRVLCRTHALRVPCCTMLAALACCSFTFNDDCT